MRGFWITVACISSTLGNTSVSADQLAQSVHDIFKDRCHSCHGQNTAQELKDILAFEDLVKDRGGDTFITPGNPEQSFIWRKISGNPPSMPEGLDGGLPEGELGLIRKWIESGAPAWERPPERQFIPEAELLKAIRDDMIENVDEEDRAFIRYFSLTHIHNNPAVSERGMQLYRAALSKALNSLSRSSSITVPVSVNDADTVFRIDFRDYGWQDTRLWSAVKRVYPYGLQPAVSNDRERRYFEDIRKAYGKDEDDIELGDLFPYMRGDWFIVNALNADKHEIYDLLLNIPGKLSELYARRGINEEEDFRINRSKRAGMLQSGVSSQNRLLEYHQDGALWISYDFKKNTAKQFLPLFPLGPRFAAGKFPKLEEFAFEQDGGEVIFELENGLHGYMLVGRNGDRISQGPVEIVFDEKKISGSPLIVNGLSCIACHNRGLKEIQDDIRDGHSLGNNREAIKKVEQLYLPREEMKRKVDERNRRYADALRSAIGTFFPDGALPETEPVSFVAKEYERPVGLTTAARELGIEDDSLLQNNLTLEVLKPLGLTPLTRKNGTIKREQWESRGSGVTVFQNAAAKLGRGTPAR